jgi:osmotically-inducible protein OsmY
LAHSTALALMGRNLTQRLPMSLRNRVPDKNLQQNVNRKLIQKCGGSNRIAAIVKNGDVTVSGTIKLEFERKLIIRTLTTIQGVGRVNDQLKVEEKKKRNM